MPIILSMILEITELLKINVHKIYTDLKNKKGGV